MMESTVVAAIVALVTAAVLNGGPLLYGTVGEVLTEKAGNLNLGVEGLMFMGGAFGLGAAFYYGKTAGASGHVAVALAILAAFLAGALGSLIYSVITITLRANQNVTGLALSIFGTGVGQYMGEYMRVQQGSYVAVSNTFKAIFQGSPFPAALQQIPVVGSLVFKYNIFVYLGVGLAIVMWFVLQRTHVGLDLRAVGESPATADAAGINVIRHKYLATVIGGGISAIGGMVYIMTIAGGVWNHDGLSGEGWLAVALVIFCLWSPLRALWGSVLFGGLLVLYLRFNLPIPSQISQILPYIVAVIVLVVISMRRKRENQAPQGLGNAYFREER